jgi:hypothetical protein
MKIELINTFKSINFSINTKLYATAAVLVGFLASIIDIFIAISFKDFNINSNEYVPILLLLARSSIALMCNFLILKFSVSSEMDLKAKSFEMSVTTRDNFFKLISFNASHMALTSFLRMVIELIVMNILAIYIFMLDSRIIVATTIIGFLYSIIFILLFKYSSNVRSQAANEQSIFLSKGMNIVALSDRAKQLSVENFLIRKLKTYSKKYTSLSVKSLFIAQSFKPILEPMLFIAGFFLVQEYSVSGAVLYLLYRIASSFVVLINGLPMMDHYMKQYKNSIDDVLK